MFFWGLKVCLYFWGFQTQHRAILPSTPTLIPRSDSDRADKLEIVKMGSNDVYIVINSS